VAAGVAALWLRHAPPPAGGTDPAPLSGAAPPPGRLAGERPGPRLAWLGQRGVARPRIAGRIVHPGRPVPRAGGRLAPEEIRIGEWALGQVIADDAGRFDLGVRAATLYRVVAQADGFAPGSELVDLRAPDPRPRPDDLTIELPDCGLAIAGSV